MLPNPAAIRRGCCLVTGGAGNLACQLAWNLGPLFERLVLVDIAPQPVMAIPKNARYERLDISELIQLSDLLKTERPLAVVHLASLLSGSSEAEPRLAWKINTTATLEILEQVRSFPECQMLFASSIATYGGILPSPLQEDQSQWPTTLYGVSKMACERLGSYYREIHGVDFRCVRLPIVISRHAPAGAISAVASRAFIESVQEGQFVFPADSETRVAGLYSRDVIKGLVDLLAAPRRNIRQPVYNLAGFTSSFGEISEAIRRELPQVQHRFEIDPKVDGILSAWPPEIDDQAARRDWAWHPEYDLAGTTGDFIRSLHAETEPSS